MSVEIDGGVCSSPESASDEKMDTCESLNSQQRTPSTPLSSPLTDCDERNQQIADSPPVNTGPASVLRIANPQIQNHDNCDSNRMDNAGVLRLNEPPERVATEHPTTGTTTTTTDSVPLVDSDNNHSDDLTTLMRKVSSNLTLTSDHPLKGLSSPESPERRAVTAVHSESQQNGVMGTQKIKLLPAVSGKCYAEMVNSSFNESKSNGHNYNAYVSTNDSWFPSDISSVSSPSVIRSYDLLQSPPSVEEHIDTSSPIEDDQMYPTRSTSRRKIVPISIPDLADNHSTCSSPGEEQSLYQASVDPFTGNACLRPAVHEPTATVPRRKIVVGAIIPDSPTETESSTDSRGNNDHSGVDSISLNSVKSEDVYVNMVKRPVNGVSGLSSGDCSRNPAEEDTDTDSENSRRDSHTRSETSEPIPEYSATDERRDSRDWVKVSLPGGGYRSIDMKVIEPYKRVLSHGGYTRSPSDSHPDMGVAVTPGAAIIVFSACFLPDSARVDYNYVMDNLFLYVLWTLERLVTDDYVLVYLHGSASRCRMPSFHWLRKCYQLIDRRLRKSLKHLYLVHPTFWLKSIVWMSRPFISTKFSQKLSYINTIEELLQKVPVEPAAIPDKVRQYEETRS